MDNERWTEERPEVEGWYWICFSWGEVKCLKVIKNETDEGTFFLTTEADGEYWIDVRYKDYAYFMGPLAEPYTGDLVLKDRFEVD